MMDASTPHFKTVLSAADVEEIKARLRATSDPSTSNDATILLGRITGREYPVGRAHVLSVDEPEDTDIFDRVVETPRVRRAALYLAWLGVIFVLAVGMWMVGLGVAIESAHLMGY